MQPMLRQIKFPAINLSNINIPCLFFAIVSAISKRYMCAPPYSMTSPTSVLQKKIFLASRGMTLLECLVATAISGLLLAGLVHIMNMSLAAQAHEKAVHERFTETMTVMRRISWAVERAQRKRTQNLTNKNPTDTGDWLDEYDPATGVTLKRRYTWSAVDRNLQEKIGDAAAVVILTNVTDFRMEAVNTQSDNALLAYTLAVGDPPDQIILSETRRLGGAW